MVGGYLSCYILTFIETKYTALEEVVMIFDRDDALVGGGLETTKKEQEFMDMKLEEEEHIEVINYTEPKV